MNEARPAWFLRENVPQAPAITPDGYDVRTFLLDNCTLDSGDGTGNEQMRRRRFWFGVRDGEAPELRAFLRFALFELDDPVQAVAGDARSVPVALGGSGRRKATSVGGRQGHVDDLDSYKKMKSPSVTGRHHSNELRDAKVRGEGWVGLQPRRSLEEMLRLQGLPPDWLKHQPWTMQAKRKIVGNGVPVTMGRELARAIRRVIAVR